MARKQELKIFLSPQLLLSHRFQKSALTPPSSDYSRSSPHEIFDGVVMKKGAALHSSFLLAIDRILS
jgi:hypothetical protein